MRDENSGADVVSRLDSRPRRPLIRHSSGHDNELVLRLKKQADKAEAAVRRDAFDVHRYDQELKVLRTILMCALSVLIVALGFSLWLIGSGREAIGSPLLSAIVSGALSYLAGLGTPRGLLRRGGPGSERGG
jgi:hypothetical protein